MDQAQKLWEIDQLRNLKARYFRFMDTKQWEAWGDLFTEDCVLQYGGGPRAVIHGRTAIVEFVRSALDSLVSCHHGHMPEIELLSDTTASGIIAMEDTLESKDGSKSFQLNGFGHYHEEYAKGADGKWRIKSSKLTRLIVRTK
jgi:SnoaL-like domain